MPLSLTCDCGARFEIEDTLAGQTVACPECQDAIKAPTLQRPPLRTSVFALASVICALVGAVTVVGTIAAVILGIIAVISILRQRDRLAGLGFAAFGIVAGTLFTGLTVLAFSRAEAFGLGNWARAQTLAAQVDQSGPLEINRPGYSVTRPSEVWGVLNGSPKDPLVKALQNNADIVLVEIFEFAFIDIKVDSIGLNRSLVDYQQQIREDLSPHRNPWDDPEPGTSPISNVVVQKGDNIVPSTKGPNINEREVVLDVRSGRQSWVLVVHMYKRGSTVYVVRCYAPAKHYDRVKDDFRKALDNFTLK